MVDGAFAEGLFADQLRPPMVAQSPRQDLRAARRAGADENRHRQVRDVARLSVVDRLVAVAVHLGEYDSIVQEHVGNINCRVQPAAGITPQVQDQPLVAGVLYTLQFLIQVACRLLGELLDFYFFFFNDTATTEIYTLSLHDALPI